jgi:predicted transcriptional regulator
MYYTNSNQKGSGMAYKYHKIDFKKLLLEQRGISRRYDKHINNICVSQYSPQWDQQQDKDICFITSV